MHMMACFEKTLMGCNVRETARGRWLLSFMPSADGTAAYCRLWKIGGERVKWRCWRGRVEA